MWLLRIQHDARTLGDVGVLTVTGYRMGIRCDIRLSPLKAGLINYYGMRFNRPKKRFIF